MRKEMQRAHSVCVCVRVCVFGSGAGRDTGSKVLAQGRGQAWEKSEALTREAGKFWKQGQLLDTLRQFPNSHCSGPDFLALMLKELMQILKILSVYRKLLHAKWLWLNLSVNVISQSTLKHLFKTNSFCLTRRLLLVEFGGGSGVAMQLGNPILPNGSGARPTRVECWGCHLLLPHLRVSVHLKAIHTSHSGCHFIFRSRAWRFLPLLLLT